MSKFTTKATSIEGVQIIKPTQAGLSRDFLYDITAAEYSEMELCNSDVFIQHNVETFPRGVLRGLHFQRDAIQAKLIAVTRGRILDVAVDMRPESREYGAAIAVELSAENESMLYIPPYFAHGFLTLERDTEVVYNCTEEHDPKAESGIIWDDEILSIDWQFERYDIDEKWLNISPRDKKNPYFRLYNPNSLWTNRPTPNIRKSTRARAPRQLSKLNSK